MVQQKVLENCYFVPKSIMLKVLDILKARSTISMEYCKRNLIRLQWYRSNKKIKEVAFKNWKTVYQLACCKAIYSHNWSKLLYLLNKMPPWNQHFESNEIALYTRALTILLMYHPTSQAQGLFNEYLHMVWSCRSNEDKKAILKVLLTLPEKLQGVTSGKYYDPNAE